ncbi:MFS transporter [Pseudomonas tohonis]|uniref:MFS transporter n=1 Tax=Pseudomonas tohonis TaxID=2725477 RepID=A0A6J4EA21_9PSED|nr:MFS transporter [Pseudomonas tohonis]BCG25381.1 MFS transporter [Pseudomonas tohonis]GJN54789.1 MFS transporter [Pseudomonas tohonis]
MHSTTATSAPSERTTGSKWALASLALATLLASLGTSIANVGLPTLADAFGAPFQDVQWVVLAYLLAITTLSVGAGRLGDLLGRRRLLLAGLLLFTGASLLCGLAPSLGWLIVARILQGLGAATMMTLAMALIGETVPPGKSGSAMGLLGTLSAIGTALGPSLGGLLLAGPGWRALFLVGLPLGLLALVLAWRHLPAERAGTAGVARFDLPGTLLLALTLAAYALAMTLGRGRFGTLNGALLLAACLGLALFVRVEMRSASPLLRLAMIRDPVLCAGLAMGALVSAVLMATLVVGPFYLAGALRLAPAQVGLAMACGPLVAALMGVPAGRLVDRLGAGPMVRLGLLGMALATLALPLLPTGLGAPGYILPLAGLTACYALFQAANNTRVMAEVPAERRGVASGLLNLSRNLGLVTGAAALGAVFAFATASDDISHATPEAIAAGMRGTFLVALGLILLALAIALAGRRR